MVSANDNNSRLEIESGPERGRQIILPAGGVRLGRDAANDVVIRDPALSRFQCRVYLGANGELRVEDLGSTNTTEVNGAPVQNVQMMPGDWITIGETIIRVVGATAGAAAGATEPGALSADTPAAPPAEITDLGLGAKPARPHAPRIIWLGLLALLVLVGGIVALKWFLQEPRRTSAAGQATLAPMQLDVQYEKVMATSTNIFRYDLSLRQGRISVRIDNLDNARHIPPKEQQVDAKVLESLAASLDNSGFFDLQPEYAGLAPDILESYDLTITLGRRTQRCRVVNRVEPEAFAKARVMVEEFAHNELHLAALAQTPEKLLELAQNAMLQGQKLYDEIGIKYANLSEAMKAFNEADICLESIDPKPDFYGKIIAGREDCKRKLQELYDDRAFRAERAIKLRDWKEASNQLRIILELIPEREDTRNQQAQVKLLDVERHLDKKR